MIFLRLKIKEFKCLGIKGIFFSKRKQKKEIMPIIGYVGTDKIVIPIQSKLSSWKNYKI